MIMLIMIMILTSHLTGIMKQRGYNKKKLSRRERRGRTVEEVRTEQKREKEEERVVRRVRSNSPTSLDSRTVSLLCRDGEWSETEPTKVSSRRSSRNSSFCLLQQSSQAHSLTSLPSLTTVSNITTNSRPSLAYLTEDEDDEEEVEEDEGLYIPSYNDLCYHILLRHQHDLQQAVLLQPHQPRQAEQLLLANLALNHAPQCFPNLKTSCIVLRGEDGSKHPIQIPIWTAGASQPRKGCGVQTESTGAKSTGKQRQQQTYNKE